MSLVCFLIFFFFFFFCVFIRFIFFFFFFFFQAEDGIRDLYVTGVQTCALPIWVVAYYNQFIKPGAGSNYDHSFNTLGPGMAGCTATSQNGPKGLFGIGLRSEEHTSELQSRRDLVCRLLLEKKKKKKRDNTKTIK